MKYTISENAHVEVWSGDGPHVADVTAGEHDAGRLDAVVLGELVRGGLATPVTAAPKASKTKESPDGPAE